MDVFLETFKDCTRVEQLWLGDLYAAVRDWIHPAVETSLGESVENLAEAVLWNVRRTAGTQSLPVSYKFVSVSELLSRQRTPCCSSLTWSTSQYKERARQAEQALPNHKALARTHLLLIGFLCDGRISGQCDGCWRIRDATGAIHCEVLNSSPLWLGKLMLLPSWNYIPQNAPGQEVGGYLELIDSPVCLTSEPTVLDPVDLLSQAIGVRKAARILRQRGSGGELVCVCGKVSVVCPLLVIAGKSFFCFVLAEEDASVPILVTDPECVHWRQYVRIGQSVCVTALRVCSVRGWARHRVLSGTPRSRLRLNPHTQDEHDNACSLLDTLSQSDSQSYTHTQSQTETRTDTHSPASHKSTQVEAHTLSEMDSQTQSVTEMHTLDPHLQQESGDLSQMEADPPARRKVSKIISYRGRITNVLNADAGLYEIDKKLGLCLAYQPQRKLCAGLRLGAEIELQNVHFLFRPSPFGPDAMLCMCLHSSLCVMAFSPLMSKIGTLRSDSPLLRYLLEWNLGVSEYLWLCYCHTVLTERLCPRWVCDARVCVVAGRLLQFALGEKEKPGKQRRDIYREMLQDPHTCPLTEYSVSCPHVSICSLKELCDWMEKECWESLSLPSLIPPSGPYLTCAQLNPLLCWSTHNLPLHSCSASTLCPPLLVGVLEVSSSRATVRLMDQTAAVECVCVEKSQSGDQLAAINTAWLGCLVCIRQCTLVMERFLKTDFPSWKHLDQQKYITHKHCRFYIQVCMNNLHILSPSASMSTIPAEQRRVGEAGVMEEVEGVQLADYSDGPTHTGRVKRKRNSEEKQEAHTKKNRDRSNGPSFEASVPCVSVIFRVDTKQGVAFRNFQTTSQAQGLKLSFTAIVTCLGDIHRWDKDPKNKPLEEREIAGGEKKVELQFVESSVRWFPLLQPTSVYRLVALNTQDVSVLCGSSVPARSGVTLLSSPSLLIQPPWRIHTLTQSLVLEQIQSLMRVSDVLSCSCEVVSLYGVISERITLQEERVKTPALQSLISNKEQSVEQGLRVRLTLQDSEAPDRRIQVYLDLSHTPYIPGLIPGATVLLHDFQRKVSIVRNVYCWSLPVSCVTVASLGSPKPHPPPPMMLLGQWVPGTAGQSIVGRVRSHVVCILSLQLKWVCSFCGSVFKQSVCTRTCPPCDSTTAVFQAEAKVAVEDGTGEAQVWFPTETVAELLLLAAAEWEGLQRHVRVRGYLRVYARGRNMVCDVDPDDPLVQYICCLCSSSKVCRQFTLTCRMRSHKPEKDQLRKVSRGEREFLTKFPQTLQLQCTHIHTSHSAP